jgi:hypothetical protein
MDYFPPEVCVAEEGGTTTAAVAVPPAVAVPVTVAVTVPVATAVAVEVGVSVGVAIVVGTALNSSRCCASSIASSWD